MQVDGSIKSKIKGISFDKSKKQWRARYYDKKNNERKTYYVGRFDTELKAIEALKKFEIKFRDENINLI